MNKFNITLNSSGAAISINAEVVGGSDSDIKELFSSLHALADAHVQKNHVRYINVIIQDPGMNKIAAIKVIREYAMKLSEKLGRTTVGSALKEAKDIIESTMPCRFPEEMEVRMAMDFAEALRAVGCSATIGDKRTLIMA